MNDVIIEMEEMVRFMLKRWRWHA